MSDPNEFSADERQLIYAAKRTLHILKQVIADKDAAEPLDGGVTPDLPQLNPSEEAAMIGQLGAAIFAELMGREGR